MTIQQLKLGDSASHSKTISETDVYLSPVSPAI